MKKYIQKIIKGVIGIVISIILLILRSLYLALSGITLVFAWLTLAAHKCIEQSTKVKHWADND